MSGRYGLHSGLRKAGNPLLLLLLVLFFTVITIVIIITITVIITVLASITSISSVTTTHYSCICCLLECACYSGCLAFVFSLFSRHVRLGLKNWGLVWGTSFRVLGFRSRVEDILNQNTACASSPD